MWEVSGDSRCLLSSFLDLCFLNLCVHGEYDTSAVDQSFLNTFQEHISDMRA